MAQKKLEKALNVDIPEQLAEDWDELMVRRGWAKKRAVAAALHLILRVETEMQRQEYDGVYDAYYAPDANSERRSESSGRAKALGHEAKAALRRGRAKDGASTTKDRGGAAG